jgi:hypothetical protein
MTRLCRDAMRHPGDAMLAAQVRRGARRAALMRAIIGAFGLCADRFRVVAWDVKFPGPASAGCSRDR